MRKQTRILSSVIGFAILAVNSLSAGIALGATNNTITSNGNGYRISPVRTDRTINAGQSSSVQVFLTDISTAKENLQVVIDDFQAKDETGTPALLLNGQSLPRHGLKQYTSLPVKTVQLNPGDTKTIFVNINIPKDAVPGGYYGAVRFSPVGPNGDRNVNLAASVGSLILVKVPGEVKENVSIVSFGVSRGDRTSSIFFGNNNLKAVVRFRNNGDIQEQPFGKILLKKGNNTLASYEVNKTDQPGNVLPDSIRRFNVNLDKVGSIGKYTVEGNFGYGTSGQLISATSTFYVVPLILAIAILAFLILIVLAIFAFPKVVRRHDRRILRRAHKG